jgi:hypothetical protein
MTANLRREGEELSRRLDLKDVWTLRRPSFSSNPPLNKSCGRRMRFPRSSAVSSRRSSKSRRSALLTVSLPGDAGIMCAMAATAVVRRRFEYRVVSQFGSVISLTSPLFVKKHYGLFEREPRDLVLG